MRGLIGQMCAIQLQARMAGLRWCTFSRQQVMQLVAADIIIMQLVAADIVIMQLVVVIIIMQLVVDAP
jgi:hypothetical protein